jgi:two-component system, cell cycle sensor histidine kinase and response regulator CckA
MTIRGTFSAPGDAERATILVVDDEEAIRRMIEKMLGSSACDVLEASSAVEALSVCESQRGAVQLVVTDVSMPGMNGFDLAERIAARWPEIQILFISGCANDRSVRRELYDRPMLSKPFTGDELNRKVRELLTPTPSTS